LLTKLIFNIAIYQYLHYQYLHRKAKQSKILLQLRKKRLQKFSRDMNQDFGQDHEKIWLIFERDNKINDLFRNKYREMVVAKVVSKFLTLMNLLFLKYNVLIYPLKVSFFLNY
jgi:hypothetical protein